MPNYIMNRLNFCGDKTQIRKMLETIQYDNLGIGSIDFNKIIPMPESLMIECGSRTTKGLKMYRQFIESYTHGLTAENALEAIKHIPVESEEKFIAQHPDIINEKEVWEFGKAAWQNIQQYGVPTWYEWSVRNWGTKWNAVGYEDNSLFGYDCEDGIRFETANSAPHAVIDKLAKEYPNIGFFHAWADEDIGSNCGELTYINGTVVEEYFPDDNIEATEFALGVWEFDDEDAGYVLNQAGTSYIRTDDFNFELIHLFGEPALFSAHPLSPDGIPKGLYCYDLCHSGKDTDGGFVAVEPKAAKNFAGCVIMKKPLDFGESGRIEFTVETEPVFHGEEISFFRFLKDQF